MFPVLPKKCHIPQIPVDRHGEKLPNLTEVEWEKADMAYPNDYLNLQRDSSRVSVYAAAEKAADYQLRLEERKQQKRLQRRSRKIEASMAKAARQTESFSELCAAITKLLNEDRVKNYGIQVRVSVTTLGSDGTKYQTTTVKSN
ncbi:hypothetical protein DICVIV_03098 [Dictyocaulus viviparus]|uniref:Uncharacterized protein n=1 Tax=Dictyocaulus viviparus TaxID=29172 RepID=A0A0D8Y855_DICVI|nr:hypothetical protein DICVIV_03098 [Dictyocaulus viviparus]